MGSISVFKSLYLISGETAGSNLNQKCLKDFLHNQRSSDNNISPHFSYWFHKYFLFYFRGINAYIVSSTPA